MKTFLYKDNTIAVQIFLIMVFINTAITTVTSLEVEEEDMNSTALNVEQYTSNLINRKLPPADYSKNIRPNVGQSPVQVNISLRINDLSEISETSMDFRVDFYVRHYWNDHRLQFPVRYNVTSITLEDDFSKQIWFPDTFFVNAKEMIIHQTVTASQSTLLRIASNGDVTHSTKVLLLASCSMDLRYFPIDQQRCTIEMASYGKTTQEVLYSWVNDSRSVEFNDAIYLPTFRLVGYSQRRSLERFTTGDYPRLVLDIYIRRHVDFYVARVYAPASLIVIISWIPFWLDRNSHSRVALGVTTVLTMTTLITNTNEGLPKISHLTALDVYLFFTFSLVFLSLIEYAVVGYYDMIVEEDGGGGGAGEGDEGKDVDQSKRKRSRMVGGIHKRILQHLEDDTSLIDAYARFIFPGLFTLFTSVYILVLTLIRVYSEGDELNDVQVVFSNTAPNDTRTIQMMMKMYLHFDVGMDYVLFKFWKPTTTFEMIYTCFALVLMGVLLEGVIYLRTVVRSRQTQTCIVNETKYYKYLLNQRHLLQTGLHGLQYVLSYYLMLVAMTYQVYFIISVISGLCLGYWLVTPLSVRQLRLQSDAFADVGH